MHIVSASIIVLAGSIIFAGSALATNSGSQQFYGLVGGVITGVGLYAWYLEAIRSPVTGSSQQALHVRRTLFLQIERKVGRIVRDLRF
ncbi:hypothetical protein [Blastopirellula retiformator]|uniref:Uncharacterized protein n=1 Tax=Blastopirellula retiformator TaxID=2527970 RepID=A0A5C5VM59_9BACT|nr:hypothetical protein [Blastopirellula retiformator]TWT39736.1 hypothetical protein Enr8_14370 [Blastopirellula retiformator]